MRKFGYCRESVHHDIDTYIGTSGYATWFTAGGCNPHRSLWLHWWRHNSETIRDREKRRPNWRHEILWAIQSWKPHRSTTTFAKP